MIKVLTGWSKPGGSTVALINLVSAFRKYWQDATLYGAHTWHLDKCQSGLLKDVQINSSDIVITHFIPAHEELKCGQRLVLSCHETDLVSFDPERKGLIQYDVRDYQFVQFVSGFQRDWHQMSSSANTMMIPNVVDDIKRNVNRKKTGVAGVIGSIDSNKQTHRAIGAALNEGFNKVYVFGAITDEAYFIRHVWAFLGCGKVKMMDHEDDKQAMYDLVDKVFHRSKRETFNLVQAECEWAGIPFDWEGNTVGAEIYDEETIVAMWAKALNV